MANSTESNREMKRISKDAPLYIGKVVDNNPKLFSKGQVLKHNDPQRKYLKEAELSVVKYQPSHSAKAVNLYRQGTKYKDQPKGDMSLKQWSKHNKLSFNKHGTGRKAYVYIASIEGYKKKGYVKIGYSSNPHDRMKTLSTNNMLTHTLEFAKLFDSGSQAENYTHFLLEQEGYKRDGEYFKVDIAKARRVIDNIIQPRVVTSSKILNEANKINKLLS